MNCIEQLNAGVSPMDQLSALPIENIPDQSVGVFSIDQLRRIPREMADVALANFFDKEGIMYCNGWFYLRYGANENVIQYYIESVIRDAEDESYYFFHLPINSEYAAFFRDILKENGWYMEEDFLEDGYWVLAFDEWINLFDATASVTGGRNFMDLLRERAPNVPMDIAYELESLLDMDWNEILQEGPPVHETPVRDIPTWDIPTLDKKKEEKADYTYRNCHNSKDYISLETFSREFKIIFVHNVDTDKIICYDEKLLLKWFRERVPMALWIGGDAMGYGGHPDLNRIVYPLPDGYLWVTECVVREIQKGEKVIQVKRIMKNTPIGNLQGEMGVSMLHGQNPQDIYGCV